MITSMKTCLLEFGNAARMHKYFSTMLEIVWSYYESRCLIKTHIDKDSSADRKKKQFWFFGGVTHKLSLVEHYI